jgi:Ser/Thr protein kinase RdoA (MazF antagonist)
MEQVAPTPTVAAAWGESLAVFHRATASYEPPDPLVFPSSTDLVRWTTARLPRDDAALDAALDDLDAWLRSLPRTDGVYGLTHGDNRSANVLWDGARSWLIDLDEPVWDWYVSDVARALLDWAERPRNERERVQRWFVDGYRRARPLEDAQVAWIPRFVQLRAIHRYAWFHDEGRAPGEGDRQSWRDWAVGTITW